MGRPVAAGDPRLRDGTSVGSAGMKTQKQIVSQSSFCVNLPINIESRTIFMVLLVNRLQCLFLKKVLFKKPAFPNWELEKIMLFEWLKSWLN